MISLSLPRQRELGRLSKKRILEVNIIMNSSVLEARRRRRRKKIIIRRLFILAVLVLFIICAMGVYTLVKNIFVENPKPARADEIDRVEIAKELQMPEWVDVQLIHKHSSARSGAKLKDIKNIVIHYVGNPMTTAQNNRDYFDKPDTEVSSHFVVGLEGEIIQCVPLDEKSAASNHRNKDTISIEVCHSDESGKFSEETYLALIKLVSHLCNHLSLDETDVIRHYDITGKNCPKYYVENEDKWKALKKDIKEALNEKN